MQAITASVIGALGLLAAGAQAGVDLVTLPMRNTVQLTIYNSADLTLVRENRNLTLRNGANKLQFSWANTLIDPTSLDLVPKAQADKLTIADLRYPPRTQNVGIWSIDSEISGEVPVEIAYLTSGLSWRAFYLGTLSPDERTMRLEGFVRVTNHSGEDYENAQTRLIVGQVHILDAIADLARRQHPFGSPMPVPSRRSGMREYRQLAERGDRLGTVGTEAFDNEVKSIQKEGLSEYFLYTIEGTETIPNGWSKRLPSFEVDAVPVVNLYKFEEERYGRSVMRFISFKNDKQHELGETPIPGGLLKVFRAVDAEARLSYAGQAEFKYIPVDEDVELMLGEAANILVEPSCMNRRTTNYSFDSSGDIDGWEGIEDWQVEVKNTRNLPVKVEVRRNFSGSKWELKPGGDFGEFEKVDLDTVTFTLRLDARTNQTFSYQLTTRHGRRAD